MVDIYILDLLVIGLLLLCVTLGSGLISRLPISFALIYLVVGISLGPYGFNIVRLRPDAEFLERLTEFVVIVSLFSCGLKMNRPLNTGAWHSTIRLIGFLMPLSIFAIAAVAHWFLRMEWGPAILLGAILAPTDPVLASEVQLTHTEDRDELRFGLTSEGGLNDALAFPFVYFGIHWFEDGNNWQTWFQKWVTVDLIWAVAIGLVMGIVVPWTIVAIDQNVRKFIKVDNLMEDFVALSIILLTYSLTEVVNGYGFLAVFVAGVVAQRRYEDPDKPFSQREFTERIEKLLEVGTILILGSMLRVAAIQEHAIAALIVGGALLFIIRPLGTWLSTIGGGYRQVTRWLFGWFGVRGVGSIYYLTYAFGHGLQGGLGEQIAWITYITIVASVILHGISTTPLMSAYNRHKDSRNRKINA
ncbi:cation:proton antiporter [Gloeocapsopsis dulcis]|uniref:Sodium:proton exchanger n=1 Tax=Gloeocapsopsis dulcis AAB1 = 1H9 TaxID=1433147 RepID=A0A6N8G4U4_9CHRO|nr:sodium:proton antiporter [Gloeocapsopsis dulcis]MUL39117.1 sodium:proton exchanger [Gloeocapsopsis dulcis AAB1 = 1H9]WNN90909.1 sodium:proton antiporter [Gloeocapsopsis dulcis]